MKQDKVCKHCSQVFKNIEGRTFSNHVRWCDHNQDNGDKGSKNLSQAKKKMDIKRLGEIKKYTVTCHKCPRKFIIEEREKKFPSKEKFFCSRSCANTREFTEETKRKISKSGSIAAKRMWQDEEYVKKTVSNTQ